MDIAVWLREGQCLARDLIGGDALAQGENAGEVIESLLQRIGGGGGSILLGSGVYRLDRTLRLPARLSFRGSGRATVLMREAGPENGGVLEAERAESIVISDLTLQGAVRGAASGICLTSCGLCEVRSVMARDFREVGLRLDDHCFMCRLDGCVTAGNGRSGTLLRKLAGSGRAGAFIPNLVIGGLSAGDDHVGFELEHSLCTNLVGCVVYQSRSHGFALHATSNSTCLSGARCFEAGGSGVWVKDSHELNINGGVFCWNKGHGIELEHVIWGAVCGNEVIDSGGTEGPLRYGIYLHTDTRSVQVTGNAIFNWEGHLPLQVGVFENDDCLANDISHNTIQYYSEASAICRGRDTAVSGNVAVAEPFAHPEREPFAHRHNAHRTREFTREPLRRFLASTRYPPLPAASDATENQEEVPQ
jgi:hypothetical protein